MARDVSALLSRNRQYVELKILLACLQFRVVSFGEGQPNCFLTPLDLSDSEPICDQCVEYL